MNLEEFVRVRGYNPTIYPKLGGPEVAAFPVVIPHGFMPSDSDGDGDDINWKRKRCPGQTGDFRPTWGGGFFAARGEHIHAAIDIMAAEGAHVVAPCTGIVPRQVRVGGERIAGAGFSRKGGNFLFLVDRNGWEWYFAHLRDLPRYAPGETVEAGKLLGYVGRTGNAARRYGDGSIRGCPHLHLRIGKQLWTPGVARKYDPFPLLKPLYDAGLWRGREQ